MENPLVLPEDLYEDATAEYADDDITPVDINAALASHGFTQDGIEYLKETTDINDIVTILSFFE